MVTIKICGIRDEVGARACAEAGVDMVGFNFCLSSRRVVSVAQASTLIPLIEGAEAVGVFVNPLVEEVMAVAKHLGLSWVQLHGSEAPTLCSQLRQQGLKVIKAVAVDENFSAKLVSMYEPAVDMLLFDNTEPGSGSTFAWMQLQSVEVKVPFLVAGGLDPQNVVGVITALRPGGVDTASGVERAGVKDPARITAFVAAARGADSLDITGDPTVANQAIGELDDAPTIPMMKLDKEI